MAKRTKAVVQWATRSRRGDYTLYHDKKAATYWAGIEEAQVVRVRITEVPAKASKRKATKRKAKR